MKKAALSVGVVLLLSCGLVLGQASGEKPKPGPEHEKLGYFVGKWKVEGDVKPNPFMPGGKVTSNDNCEWFDGRFGVVCRGEGQCPMGATKMLGIMSYSGEEKKYTYYGLDNSGMAMSSIPLGTRQGTTWLYENEGKMGGKTIKSRYTIKEISPTSYTFKWEMLGDDGAWMAVTEGKATKS